MFSMQEKRRIAEAVEKVLLELDHPEMPKENPVFTLTIKGKELWSFAIIEPNWVFDDGKPMGVNPFNEVTRKIMK